MKLVREMSQLLNQIADKTLSKEDVFEKIEHDFTLIPIILNGTTSAKANVRYTCTKVLIKLSEKHSENIYPYITQVFALLKSNYRIIKWNGLQLISNLASVDKNNVFDDNFDDYFNLLNDGYMVTVANVATFSSKIALAKPYLADRIAKELLKVENVPLTPHLTEECRRVIAEKTIASFGSMFNLLEEKLKNQVIDFVKRQLDSPRVSLRKEAEEFLKEKRQERK